MVGLALSHGDIDLTDANVQLNHVLTVAECDVARFAEESTYAPYHARETIQRDIAEACFGEQSCLSIHWQLDVDLADS